MHRKVNPLLGPGPGGVGNVWFSGPHYLIGKGRQVSRPLSRLPIDVSLYPSSRSRNCRSIGVSNYRSLEQIEKMSQYRSLEHCGVIASHIRPLPQTEGVWEDTRMLNDKTRCARAPTFKGAGHLCSSDRYCDSFEVPAR